MELLMRILILAAVAAGIVATPAFAQTAQAPFTGLRIEGVAGYDSLRDGHSSNDGLVYGGAVGYDVQLNTLVIGAEGELTGSTTDTRASNLVAPGDRFRVGMGRDVYLGGRVGFPLNATTMAYAKGGYTNARVDTRYDVGTASTRDHINLEGFRLGAGLEHQLGANTYIKGEYRYSNYGSANGAGGSYDIDADRHQLVAGVGMRF